MTEERITVVFFHIGTETFGGGSQMLVRLFNRIDKNQFKPILLADNRGRLWEEATEMGIETHVVPFRGSLKGRNGKILDYPIHKKIISGIRLLQYNREASKILKKGDILWGLNIRAVLTLIPFQMSNNIPLIWNIGLGFKSEGSFRYLNELALQFSNFIFIESETQAKRLFTNSQYRRHQHKFDIFHKGIDTKHFDPKKYTPVSHINNIRIKQPSIGTAALLNPRKGHEYLIEAAAKLSNQDRHINIYIAGEVPQEEDKMYKRELESLCAKLGISDQVHFLGWIESMPSFLASLDVFVLPSLNEGIPGVVREALSMETPTVATDVGGTSDVIRHGKTGILVKPKDPEAIADGVHKLLDDREYAKTLAEAGRELIIREHSAEIFADRYEQYLMKVYNSE